MKSSSSPSSSSSATKWRYDVFLNFRGKDTRNTFTRHLREALRGAGVNTFNADIGADEDIKARLEEAIQGSKISINVFSKNFAESHWCLDELVKIMECRRSVKQMVLPVFRYMNPSDVRHQKGSFAKAFERHEKRFDSDEEMKLRRRYHLLQDPREKPYDSDPEPERVQRFRNALKEKLLWWKNALKQAADLAGFVVDGRHEAKEIEEIVKVVLRKLNRTELFIGPHVVGIRSHMNDVTSRLALECEDRVRTVGIGGLGGIGKTTIAKAIYNEFFEHFDGSSFLENVREIWQQPHFRVSLQERLLYDTLSREIKINNIDGGIMVIKERLCRARVLVIIDDVDHLDQLYAIVGSDPNKWFGRGSRIIITSRDKHILNKVDSTYFAEKMSDSESLKLFSFHAFGKGPQEKYFELSKSVVSYCGGLPLALKVLGSFLNGREPTEWSGTLEKLRRIPHHEIQQKLRISYDSLTDKTVKAIFLDISCFFIGEDRDYVQQILDGCNLYPQMGINILSEKCLVTINEQNKLMVHDLLRDIARDIVREKSLINPGKWSRLWYHEDVIDVLEKAKGTKSMEGISLKLERGNKQESFKTESFKNMQSVRLLQLNYVKLTGSYEHISKDLRWLCWEGFPLKFIPDNFYLKDLVTMELRYSNLKKVWHQSKLLFAPKKLTYLDLSHSHRLTHTPDFSVLPNLKKLILEDCTSLKELHDSSGDLDKLVLLTLEGCKILKNLPKSFYKLKSLKILVLSGCSMIDHLDEDLGKLVSLTMLLTDNTGIKEPPRTIVRLSKLARLSICGFKASSSDDVSKLFLLWTMPLGRDYSMNLLSSPFQGLQQVTLSHLNLGGDDIPEALQQRLRLLTFVDSGENSSSSLTNGIYELNSPTPVDSRVHEVVP